MEIYIIKRCDHKPDGDDYYHWQEWGAPTDLAALTTEFRARKYIRDYIREEYETSLANGRMRFEEREEGPIKFVLFRNDGTPIEKYYWDKLEVL